jgi:type IV secretory pathway protease TraF
VIRTSSAVSERRSPWRAVALSAALAGGFALTLQHVRVVLTPSVPRGLYLLIDPPQPLRPGILVSFCPPPAISALLVNRHLEPGGTCPGGSIPLAKRIQGFHSRVCATPSGLQVGDQLLPWPNVPPSLPVTRYGSCGPTSSDCVFLVGDSSDSLDSRFFGCVPESRIQHRLLPIFVEGAL